MILAVLAVVASGTSFTCTPTRVWDGDGPIACAEGPKIRLAGIAAREIDGTCKRAHPCPRAGGVNARDHLVKLLGGAAGSTQTGHVVVRGPALRCRSEGSGKRERTAAWCRTASGINLNCAMVASGYALRWATYDRRDRCR